MYNALVIFYLQSVIVFSNSTYFETLNSAYTSFQKLTFKTCWNELYLAIGLPTPLLLEKNLILSPANTVTHFSLIIAFKSTLPDWIGRVLSHLLSACCDGDYCEIISKKYHKSRVEKYFAGFLSWYFEEIELTLSSFAAEYRAMTKWPMNADVTTQRV